MVLKARHQKICSKGGGKGLGGARPQLAVHQPDKVNFQGAPWQKDKGTKADIVPTQQDEHKGEEAEAVSFDDEDQAWADKAAQWEHALKSLPEDADSGIKATLEAQMEEARPKTTRQMATRVVWCASKPKAGSCTSRTQKG